MKIGIDIGGVISRYPSQMMMLIDTFNATGHQVYILTDMAYDDAVGALRENGFGDFIGASRIISCDWPKHGDLCKTIKAEELGLDILIDDRPDYLASGYFIGLCLSPRPNVPYYHPSWVNKSTPTVCVPPEEYEAFKRWREQQS
jgi:hypothetical protein